MPIFACITSILSTPVAPSAPPSAVHLQPQSAYSISVNWTLPPLVDRNGPITGYVLRHWQANEGPETNRDTAIGLVQMHRLENLQPFTGYSVQVAAVNVNGTGPFSTFQETKTLSAGESAPCRCVILIWSFPATTIGRASYRSPHTCQSYITAFFNVFPFSFSSW